MAATESKSQRASVFENNAQLEINQRKYFVVDLRHKITNMWLHGANFNEWNFEAGNTAKIIEFLQASFPKYEKFNCVKSFVYRAINRLRC